MRQFHLIIGLLSICLFSQQTGSNQVIHKIFLSSQGAGAIYLFSGYQGFNFRIIGHTKLQISAPELAHSKVPVMAKPTQLPGSTSSNNALATPTPIEDIPAADPKLLQSMILLGVVMVIIILLGVWINRDQINLR